MKKAETQMVFGAGSFIFSAFAGEFIFNNYQAIPFPKSIIFCGLLGIILFIIGYTRMVISSNKRG